MRKIILPVAFVSAFLLNGCRSPQSPVDSCMNFKSAEETQEFFSYKNDNSIIISGHRGGREKGYPENSIEGFENVLNQMCAFFEIDPRLTKDSVIVLMHDETLNRTTDATGKLSDYTWAELQTVNLKDNDGNVTQCKIPTLEETIIWSRGKTVINLDKKDVPLHMIADLIKKHNAQAHVMLTVHTGEQARYYHDRLPEIMFSVFARNDKEFEDMSQSGVPWKNMIAYVGATIDGKNKHIVEQLRAHGVRCMISVAPTHDRLLAGERAAAYRSELKEKPDIIESDYPVDTWNAVKDE